MAKPNNLSLFAKVLPSGGLSVKINSYVREQLTQLAGEDVEVVVKRIGKRRSSSQNAWLWGVAYKMICEWWADKQGEPITPAKVHMAMKTQLLGEQYEVQRWFGKTVIVPTEASTKELTTEQFTEYMIALQAFWAEYGLQIPDPNEVQKNDENFSI